MGPASSDVSTAGPRFVRPPSSPAPANLPAAGLSKDAPDMHEALQTAGSWHSAWHGQAGNRLKRWARTVVLSELCGFEGYYPPPGPLVGPPSPARSQRESVTDLPPKPPPRSFPQTEHTENSSPWSIRVSQR